MNKHYLIIIYGFIVCSILSCNHYLDVKPNMKLSTPETPKDLQAVLDMISFINDCNPALLEIASDNFFLKKESWQALTEQVHRDEYIWNKTPVSDLYWSYLYKKIYTANIVFDYIEKVKFKSEVEKKDILGQAYFVRGLAYLKVAELFSKPYNPSTAKSDLGIVLRKSSNINVPSTRSTVEETYDQIEHDLLKAIQNLAPYPPKYVTRPSKAAAFALLSRVHMNKRAYEIAGIYADSSFRLQNELINYNLITSTQPYPFEIYNKEVIYHSKYMPIGNAIRETFARVDTLLYASYDDNDRRKKLFFTKQTDGYYAFTGDYSRSNAERFDGITTAEVLLNRAECYARTNEIQKALQDISLLISHRYTSKQLPTQWDKDQLIDYIIQERRKELISRGQRWNDIRRLSFENTRAIDLRRNIGFENYGLSVKEIQEFAFYLPATAIELGKLIQN